MLRLLLLGAVITTALGIPVATETYVVHQRRDGEVNGNLWIKREAHDPDAIVPVRIALTQRNLERGMDLVMAVADPDSPTYGKYYTPVQIRDIFAPAEESVSKVKRWLIDSGINGDNISIPSTRSWLQFETRISHLESLLNAKYHIYDNLVNREQHLGTDEYHVPENIAAHIDFVVPGTAFTRVRRREPDLHRRGHTREKGRGIPLRPISAEIQSAPGSLANCSRMITPACIKAMYKIPDGKLAHPANRLKIFELDGDFYLQSDMDKFSRLYAPYVPAGTGPLIHNIDGSHAVSPTGLGGPETTLDFEMAVPIIYPQGTVLYSAPYDEAKVGIFNLFLDAMDGSYCNSTSHGVTGDTPTIDGTYPVHECGTIAATNVISISYGFSEYMYPSRYLERQCDEWMKLALAGKTIVIATGDDGVAGNGAPCLGDLKNIFVPDAVSSCPYVTAVGTTVLPPHKRPGDAETATTSFSSGGGFSNIFTTPSYQKSAVEQYLWLYGSTYPSYKTRGGHIPKNGGVYNSQGRGFPDLACNGDNSAVITNGDAWLGGGTSQAAPIVAAIFTRINEERLAANKSLIGFVNPVLYKHPEMFNDITEGKQDKGGLYNNGCGNDGFQCGVGWDPVTGLGTPHYPRMLNVFMSLVAGPAAGDPV